MTIGIYNILTTIWFILMISCGSHLAYISWDIILYSDLIFIAKFFVTILCIATLGTVIFILIKLRLLIITKEKLISIYLFRFKKTTILINEIVSSKWSTWDIKAHRFITLKITDKYKNQVSISDFEFENFESIALSLLGKGYKDKTLFHFQSQARLNYSLTFFIAILTTVLLIFTFDKLNWEKNFYINVAFIILNPMIILASIKRILNYRRIKKDIH